ncbi:MAG: hypothetical protein ACYC3I_22840 [Gemmataceae bacterium]
MQAISRLVAFALMGFLLSLSVLGADDKDKKTDPPKDDAKKSDVKKDEPAKKDAKTDEPAKKDAKTDEPAKKDAKTDEPAKKDAKTDEPAKKDADKKDAKKSAGMTKLPTAKGKFKGVDTDPAAAEKKMMKKAQVQATVVNVVEDKKTLRLRLTIPYVRINEGQLQNYNNAVTNMMRATKPQDFVNAQNAAADAAALVYEIATVQKEVEWTAADEIKVRAANPPPQFDDKGRPKRYTSKELRELRGTDKLPGFPAEFSDIKSGQTLVVTLLQKKTGPRPVRRGKDAEAEPSSDALPKMSFILIMDQPKN